MKSGFIVTLLILIMFYRQSIAQQKNAEQIMEDAKKQLSDDREMDPDIKKQIMNMLSSNDAKEAISNSNLILKSDFHLTTLPKPDRKRLAMISDKVISKEQLNSLVENLSQKIKTQVSPEILKDVQQTIIKANGNGAYLSAEAVSAWYNGTPQKAFFLAASAVKLQNNINSLNNLGAMLNLCGYEEKAVAVLQFALQMDKENSTVLNNLGRAYLGLGDKEKAEEVYLTCVRYAPNHPEANNALGCLYEEDGDPKKARNHFEKSLDGAYNENAAKSLDRLSPDFNIVFSISKHHKAPEYFNQFKFRIPEECFKGEDYFRVKALHEAFQQSISDLQKQYSTLQKALEMKGHKEIKNSRKNIMEAIQRREIPALTIYPFAVVSGRMLLKLHYNFQNDKVHFIKDFENSMHKLNQKHLTAIKQMEDKFKSEYVFGTQGELSGCLNCEEVEKRMCAALKQVDNGYQEAAASLHAGFVDKYKLLLTGYFDEFVYWNSLSGVPKTLSDAEFYTYIHDFLSEIAYLSKTTPFIAGPGRCDGSSAEKILVNAEKYKADKKPECPINLDIPFVIGKLSLDCSSFSISGGEGVTGSYKKNFVSGQSTISIGAGLTMEIGGAGVSAGAGASESIYITFDKNGNPTDAGLKFDAGGKLKMGNISSGAGAGYTMGMNSGWDFTGHYPGETIKL